MGSSAVFIPIVMRFGDSQCYIKAVFEPGTKLVLGSWFRLDGTKIFKFDVFFFNISIFKKKSMNVLLLKLKVFLMS